jgi:hypothetical protein
VDHQESELYSLDRILLHFDSFTIKAVQIIIFYSKGTVSLRMAFFSDEYGLVRIDC